MIFRESKLPGVFIIDIERREDERGFFSRSFCQREFEEHGLKSVPVQCNISFNARKGTLRGMHFQRFPKAEAKLVRCTQGSIFDVFLDLRSDSATYCQWDSVELTAANRRAIYIPEGFAHGFQTLENDSEVFYQMFEFYSPEHADGVRCHDPAFSIKWPLQNPVMSEKDRSYPLYKKVSG